MVEVFTTDVQKDSQARAIVNLLQRRFPGSKINFDLDDCDKILRVEGVNFVPENVASLVKEKGFKCRILE